MPAATQPGTRLATARAVSARPFSLRLAPLSGSRPPAAPPGIQLARRLSGERLTAAAHLAGALRERRAAMDDAAEGEEGRRDLDERGPAAQIPLAPEGALAPRPEALGPPAATGATQAAPALDPARSLAGLVAAERLTLELQRRERAAGPELRMSLGSALEISLVQGRAGVELAVAGRGSLARLAGVELPSLVRALDRGGVRVARAEVRPALAGRPGPARAPALTASGGADRTLVRQG